MVDIGIVNNLSDLINILPPKVFESLLGLILILKAVGIAFILYVIYSFILLSLNLKRIKQLKRLEKKIERMDSKLNKILKNSIKKSK